MTVSSTHRKQTPSDTRLCISKAYYQSSSALKPPLELLNRGGGGGKQKSTHSLTTFSDVLNVSDGLTQIKKHLTDPDLKTPY